MKKYTTLLKTAVIIIGIPVFILTFFMWFSFGTTVLSAVAEGLTLGYIFLSILTGVTLTVIPYFSALIQGYKLVTYIDKKTAFSNLAVVALKKIKRYAFIISAVYVALLPLVYVVAEWDDAPGLIIMGAIPMFAAFVVATFSAVLEHLLDEAVQLKFENDLTI